jgi:uncharacterized protein
LGETNAYPVLLHCAGRSRAEQLICADPVLSRLDEDLNALYRRTLAAHGEDKDVLRVLQRAWLQGCSATMRLSGTALIVEDESGCGGNQVSFDGTCRRK